MSSIDQISPMRRAEDMRARANEVQGSERAYFLWLAAEWDKTAARYPSASEEGAHRALVRPPLRYWFAERSEGGDRPGPA